MSRKANLGLVLAKSETTYATDASPAAATDVMLAEDIEIQPLEMETDDYAPVEGAYGSRGKIVSGTYSQISFKVKAAGGGTPLGAAGGEPVDDVLLKACGWARSYDAGVSVDYALTNTGEQSCTIYYFVDGIRQRMVGCFGEMSVTYAAGKGPMREYRFWGVNVPMTDVSLPTPTLPSVPRPVAVNKNNTTITIDGYELTLESLTLTMGNDVQYRNRTNLELVNIVGRQPAGRIALELPLVATKDFLGASGICTLGTEVALSIVHGTAAGNIVTETCPRVQLLRPRTPKRNGILMLECELHLAHGAAVNDEWAIACT